MPLIYLLSHIISKEFLVPILMLTSTFVMKILVIYHYALEHVFCIIGNSCDKLQHQINPSLVQCFLSSYVTYVCTSKWSMMRFRCMFRLFNRCNLSIEKIHKECMKDYYYHLYWFIDLEVVFYLWRVIFQYMIKSR